MTMCVTCVPLCRWDHGGNPEGVTITVISSWALDNIANQPILRELFSARVPFSREATFLAETLSDSVILGFVSLASYSKDTA
jgi:hypothetical protein